MTDNGCVTQPRYIVLINKIAKDNTGIKGKKLNTKLANVPTFEKLEISKRTTEKSTYRHRVHMLILSGSTDNAYLLMPKSEPEEICRNVPVNNFMVTSSTCFLTGNKKVFILT